MIQDCYFQPDRVLLTSPNQDGLVEEQLGWTTMKWVRIELVEPDFDLGKFISSPCFLIKFHKDHLL